MSLQRRPVNPVEKRKRDVRRYSQQAVVGVGSGIVGGVVLGLVAGSWGWFFFGLLCALAIGGVNAWRINKIIRHRDDWS
ncbi:hypothetical protein ACFSSC_11465 [Corynebacterium mendelii]|uniref:Uncharacterized protein n=1 Tax=Corynebacterium mendelii TaxID=2765362 RepID=A0A939DZD6_9CORY|nr:hypothetical protein [Corynebacterium mendelii]MBN9643631.1 hypothetical protein [Corynebacterium mendelii]